jgi:hypothetical protein
MITFPNSAREGRRPSMRHARTKLSRVLNSSLALDRVRLPHNESPPRGESFGAGKMETPRERSLSSCHSHGALHSLPRDRVSSGEVSRDASGVDRYVFARLCGRYG